MKKLLLCLFLTLLLSAFLTSTSLAGDLLASSKNNGLKGMAEDAKSLIQIIEASKKASIREAKQKQAKKTWKTVETKTLTGSVKDNAYEKLLVSHYGTTIKVGYKMFLWTENGEFFYVSIGKKFVKQPGKWEFVNQNPGHGLLEALADEGVKIHWKLQKKIQFMHSRFTTEGGDRIKPIPPLFI